MGKENKSLGGIILGSMMIALAGFLIGGYGGSQLTGSYFLNQHLQKDARDVQTLVDVLQFMQTNENSKAMSLLESRLDNDLILFDPREPYEGLAEETQIGIDKAIKSAKAYRGKFPRNSNGGATGVMVKNLFKKVK